MTRSYVGVPHHQLTSAMCAELDLDVRAVLEAAEQLPMQQGDVVDDGPDAGERDEADWTSLMAAGPPR